MQKRLFLTTGRAAINTLSIEVLISFEKLIFFPLGGDNRVLDVKFEPYAAFTENHDLPPFHFVIILQPQGVSI